MAAAAAVTAETSGSAASDMLPDALDMRVGDLMQDAPAIALPHETCRLVATRLAVHGLERLPVVADRKSMRLIGIVSRSDLIKPSLGHFEEEHKREQFRYIGFWANANKGPLAAPPKETTPHS
jgi:predicted transcriptional regulator